MIDEICAAIRSHRLLRITYDGGPREVEPYCYGVSTTGKEVLRGFQLAGPGRTGRTSGWRLFDVSRIGSLAVLEDEFPGNRPEYRPVDRAMIRQFCNL